MIASRSSCQWFYYYYYYYYHHYYYNPSEDPNCTVSGTANCIVNARGKITVTFMMCSEPGIK